jgi:hypothetical protein
MADLDAQPREYLTELGRESWRRRQEQERRRLERLAETRQESERAHTEWERLREQYRDNEPVQRVLDGHEPSLDEGGGWAIRMPVIWCEVCGFTDETGERWGTWPCWTYETLVGAATEDDADD